MKSEIKKKYRSQQNDETDCDEKALSEGAGQTKDAFLNHAQGPV